MTHALDRKAAGGFLEASRSTFLREAGRWLATFDDPADLLLLLSGEVGQHLGPWDCFRHCGLLGLHHSAAVKSLALDVLSEPVGDEEGPPIAPAYAVAWAKDRFPDEEAPFAQALLESLHEHRDDPRAHRHLVDAAMLALCGPQGAAPDELRGEMLEDLLEMTFLKGDATPLAVPIWEAAELSGSPLAPVARGVAIGGQQQDGGLTALSNNALLRGFATVRGLALDRRAEASAG